MKLLGVTLKESYAGQNTRIKTALQLFALHYPGRRKKPFAYFARRPQTLARTGFAGYALLLAKSAELGFQTMRAADSRVAMQYSQEKQCSNDFTN
jgi:hypothetical protein